MKWLYVVVANGGDCVVGFSVPEQNHVTGIGVVVASKVVGKGSSLKILHIDVRQWTSGRLTYAKSLELLVEVAPLPEVGQMEVVFEYGQDVVDPEWSALAEFSVTLEFLLGELESLFLWETSEHVF